MESWKTVSGYEHCYEVSNLGNVRSLSREQVSYGGRKWVRDGMLLKATLEVPYLVVALAKFGKRKRFYVHELVLTAFRGERPPGFHGCHNDGNGQNNNLSNLRWATPQSNNEDKRIHKTMPVGESHGMNKYSVDQILAVKKLLVDGLNSAREIELITGVARTTVAAIRAGRQWQHLNLPE